MFTRHISTYFELLMSNALKFKNERGFNILKLGTEPTSYDLLYKSMKLLMSENDE